MQNPFTRIIQRFRTPPSGYQDPTLTETFNALAQSPFGSQAIDFCKSRDYKIIVSDSMKAGISGICNFDRIHLRPHACHSVMAHEMRHAFQMHHMKTHRMGRYNPIFTHMEIRMAEADAFTFATLVNLSRWKELGVSPKTVYHENKNDTSRTDILAYQSYVNHDHDPQVLLQILRSVFDQYYFNIATYSNSAFSYEAEGMAAAEKSYKALEQLLLPPRTMMHAVMKAMFYPDHRLFLQKALDEYDDTENLVDDLASRLGHIPGMKGNYLTDTIGYKLSHVFYLGASAPAVQNFHDSWRQKIEGYFRGQKLLRLPCPPIDFR